MSTTLERDEELTALVQQLAEEHSTPGVSVGVLHRGRSYAAPVGVTSTADPLPVDGDTLFMIGSTSKTFTATALLALVDEGGLSLTDRIIDHLPEFRLRDEQAARTVTVEHLLNHTSGWRGDLHPDTGWGDDALQQALAAIADAPQDNPPGTLASYSNSGFLLAGHLLATLRKSTYEQAVRELVLEPLKLADSHYLPWETANRRHAVGHIVQDGVATPVLPYPLHRSTNPAGGLSSSLRDQLSYASYHLTGATTGTPPLRDATRLRMQQPTIGARSTIDGIGLSWLLSHHGDVRLVTHGGNVSNLQTSTFVLAPDHDFAVTVMTNTKQGPAIGARVLAWALERFLGVGAQPAMPTVPCQPGELAGTYDLGPYAWGLTETEGRLYVELRVPDDVPEEVRIAFTSPAKELVAVARDVYALASDPTTPVLDVRRSADGGIDGVVHGMRFARRAG